MLVTPLLFDPCTIIGVSNPLIDKGPLPSDNRVGVSGAVACGNVVVNVTGGLIIQFPSPRPGGFPTNNDAIFTDVLNINMTDGAGTTITAGASAPAGIKQGNFGEVESMTCNNISCSDFPASSFFNVFVHISVPGGLGFYNKNPLMVIATLKNVTDLPPKVTYIHNNTGFVEIFGDPGTPFANQPIGKLIVSGHAIGFNVNNPNDVSQFRSAFDLCLSEAGISTPHP
jgi:hypothetical protein